MLKITKFTCEHLENYCLTDNPHPHFSFALESTNNEVTIKSCFININNWKKEIIDNNNIVYNGDELTPFTKYKVKLEIEDNFGDKDQKELLLETGFMNSKWQAKWISDNSYHFKEKKVSPRPMIFQKNISLKKKVKEVKIFSTALGIYNLYINNKKIGDQYFAPGFTSYKSFLQYQTYDITSLIKDNFSLYAVVAGGWAVGSFVFTRKNRITAPRQALLLQIRIVYEDNSTNIISTDESWLVSTSSPFINADFYDGETFDANIEFDKIAYHNASIEKVKISPTLIADYGSPVKKHEIFAPINTIKHDNEIIYDFGQNFAGLVCLKINNAKKGQLITVRHAEVLTKEKRLNTSFLRSAKATINYICKDGNQTYSPSFTYMGFRYVSVSGIKEEDLEISAFALYSDIEQIGHFECSNPLLNKLQQNICWSAKSNFVDIPTDCPQRDERMGWTGDLAVFSPTAEFNFNINRFLSKWLKDLRAEQLKTGGIPNTIPSQGYGFPATMPKMAVEFWGDACILIPYNHYLVTGDVNLLETMYPSMKKYVDACIYWAHFLSLGEHRYIWHTPSLFHFGDWVAADVDKMSVWQKRSKYTATASLKNTSHLLSKIANILGYSQDKEFYDKISSKTSKAYQNLLLNKQGKLKNEFQTGYVLPIYYDMLDKNIKKLALENLVTLIKNNDYCLGTGFPGTPYILFALADNGYSDIAYKMLLNTKCPSWLYEVKVGATTIWERWDGLNELGECEIGNDGTGGMISFNHYAFGAVGDFLYKRLAGINIIEAGYRKVRIEPLIGGDITYVNASTLTPYGKLFVQWQMTNDKFSIFVKVPIFCHCEIILPSKKIIEVENGSYTFEESLTLMKK